MFPVTLAVSFLCIHQQRCLHQGLVTLTTERATFEQFFPSIPKIFMELQNIFEPYNEVEAVY